MEEKKSWKEKRKARKEEKKRIKQETKMFRKGRRIFRIFMWLIILGCFGIPIVGHFWFRIDSIVLCALVLIYGLSMNFLYNRRIKKIQEPERKQP